MLVSTVASAEIPQVIGYQGRVTDNSGVPVADGSYTMRFRIYDAQTGGTQLWNSGTHSIPVADGIFNVLLGQSPQTTLTLLFDEDYWLLVTFDGEDQLPRRRLASVGYAYMASGLVPGTIVSGPVTTSPYSVISGQNAATGGIAYGIHGSSASTIARGVYGDATAASGTTYGVFGRSSSPAGRAVYGVATATAGSNYGVYGRSTSTGGTGVYGAATATTGTIYGVYGTSASTDGRGVCGVATATEYPAYGGYFESSSSSGRGVYGAATSTVGWTYGVDGRVYSTDGIGVGGFAYATVGTSTGVFGRSYSTEGRGVRGWATAESGTTYGVRGEAVSSSGRGVYGEATATTGTTYGVYGMSSSSGGTAVYGEASASSGLGVEGYAGGIGGRFTSTSGGGIGVVASAYGTAYNFGVDARTWSTDQGRAVSGLATASTGINHGIYGGTASPTGYGGYFEDDVHVEGVLSKGSGSFVIDHPLDPENRLLRHNFVESPENLLIYRGTVQLDARGGAVIQLPEYFVALTRETGASVQLTPLGEPFLTGYGWGPDHGSFTVKGDAGREVSWMAMAERDDPVIHQLARPVEEDKGPDNKYCDRGKLIYPTAYGYPESMGKNHELHMQARRTEEEALQRLKDRMTE
jgi:hypothetical protein